MFKKYHNCFGFFSTLIPLFSTAIHHVASLCLVQDEISSRQLCVSGRNAMWEPSGSSFIYSGYARCAHQVDSTWKNNRRQCSVTYCRTHEAADVLCLPKSSWLIAIKAIEVLQYQDEQTWVELLPFQMDTWFLCAIHRQWLYDALGSKVFIQLFLIVSQPDTFSKWIS